MAAGEFCRLIVISFKAFKYVCGQFMPLERWVPAFYACSSYSMADCGMSLLRPNVHLPTAKNCTDETTNFDNGSSGLDDIFKRCTIIPSTSGAFGDI